MGGEACGCIEASSFGEASRTGLSLSPARLIDQAGPLSFEGRQELSLPPRFPRFPVTAGNRSGRAKRPLDSARVARWRSQRRVMAQLERSSSCPRGWPWVWRLCLPFSSCPPFSCYWRISFCLPPSFYQLFSLIFSSSLMPSSSSFSFRLFSLFSSPSSSPSRLLNKRSPGFGPDYPTGDGGVPPPAC